MYHVISPDGFPMTCKPFPTEQEAVDAIPLLCKRYEHQGYYSTSWLHRIPLDELPDYIYVREV